MNLTENQLKYSNERARKENLENQVNFKLLDYRFLKEKLINNNQ